MFLKNTNLLKKKKKRVSLKQYNNDNYLFDKYKNNKLCLL